MINKHSKKESIKIVGHLTRVRSINLPPSNCSYGARIIEANKFFISNIARESLLKLILDQSYIIFISYFRQALAFHLQYMKCLYSQNLINKHKEILIKSMESKCFLPSAKTMFLTSVAEPGSDQPKRAATIPRGMQTKILPFSIHFI